MRTRAPGKIVLSGAYAVLEGAPALVTAIDRYVTADTSKPPEFEAPEARAAIPDGVLPHVDVSALRKDGRKLGLGSSAAVVVACLAAIALERLPRMSHAKLARTVLEPAIYAHRAAQGGGSGIDVVASVHGGTRLCWLVEGKMLSDVHFLPQGLDVKVFAARTSCSTKEMLQTVHAWAKQEPRGYQRLMDALFSAASATASASDIDTYVASTAAQCAYLEQLGNKSGAPIVPAWLHELAISAHRDKVAIHPSGAGGGDIVLCIGRSEACEQWKERLEGAGLESLDVHVHAQGVHFDPARDSERDPETIAR